MHFPSRDFLSFSFILIWLKKSSYDFASALSDSALLVFILVLLSHSLSRIFPVKCMPFFNIICLSVVHKW